MEGHLKNLLEEIKRLESKVSTLESFSKDAVETLEKVTKSAEFFSTYADCRNDSWACSCRFCKDTENSKNMRSGKEFMLKNKDLINQIKG